MAERKEPMVEERAQSEKKPYVKPALQRLGTVEELTHGRPSKGNK